MAIKVLEFRSDAPYQAGLKVGEETEEKKEKKELLKLLECLSKDDRLDVIDRMIRDEEYLNGLYKHYHIQSPQEAEETVEPVKEAK